MNGLDDRPDDGSTSLGVDANLLGPLADCTSPTERAIEEAAPGTDVEIERGGERIIVEDDDGS